ncbi:MAG: hypothetical protein REI12_06430 [Pedobacter sp.]|nr:hypothetical protein [Pedobacter sp.]
MNHGTISTTARFKKTFTGAMVAGLLAGSPLLQAATSPLVTADQKALDSKAAQINSNWDYPALKAEVRAAYVAAYAIGKGTVSAEAQARLDNAVDELAFSAIQKAVNNDPWFPKVYWLNTPPHAWAGSSIPGGRYSFDNPDNIYRTIPIAGDGKYEITGKRYTPGPTDITFSLISNPNAQQTIAYLTGNDIVVNTDGSYTVTVDSQPANGRKNHIQSTSAAKQLFIRNNLGNWNTETPDALSVKRLDSVPWYVLPKSNLTIGSEAWGNLQESVVTYGVGALGVKTYVNALNTLANPSSSSTLGTLVTQASSFGHFRIADDEALVVTVNTGGAGYFVLPVTDAWSVTVDPVNHQSSLNNKQAVLNANGTYTFVVSPKDPGVFNWVDTVGQHEGTIMARWQNLPAQSPASGGPAIAAQLVKLNQLNALLPAGTRFVSAAERAAQIQARQAGFARRLQ